MALILALVGIVVGMWLGYGYIVEMREIRVRHQSAIRRIDFDYRHSLLNRYVDYRDACVRQGVALWKKGVVELSPHAYPTRWEYASAVCRYVLGKDSIGPYVAEILPPSTVLFETTDGLLHRSIRLRINQHEISMLACAPDEILEEEENPREEMEESVATTCLACLGMDGG